MPYLHDQQVLFEELVVACANAMRLPQSFVIKDYFIAMMLKEMALANSSIVFKGGTSLSKSHGIIERFSEDIDIGMELAHPTESQRKSMKAAVIKAAEKLDLTICNLADSKSKRAFNRYLISLPGISNELSDALTIETALQAPVEPVVEKDIDSYIFRFMATLGLIDEVARFSLAPFSMRVSSIERTFVDKVFAICDYYLNNLSVERQSRHIYDLYKMMPLIALDDSLADLFRRVKEQRKGLYGCSSAREGIDVSLVLKAIVISDAYRLDYQQVTTSLLFEEIRYEIAVGVLPIIAEFLGRIKL